MSEHHSPLIEQLEHLTSEVASSFDMIQNYLTDISDRPATEEIISGYLFKLLSVNDWMKHRNPSERERTIRKQLDHITVLLDRSPVQSDVSAMPLLCNRTNDPTGCIEILQDRLPDKFRAALESFKLILSHFREQPTETIHFGRVVLEPRNQHGLYFLLPSVNSNLEVMVDCDFSPLFQPDCHRPVVKDITYRLNRGSRWSSILDISSGESLSDLYVTLEHGIESITIQLFQSQ